MKATLIFFLLFSVFCLISSADELLVPDEYATIADAVAASASGDVIRLVSSEVEWGGPITIENKNLTIEGAEEFERVVIVIVSTLQFDDDWKPIFDPETKTLWLMNSRLTLKNIQIAKPVLYFLPGPVTRSHYPSPIVVDTDSSLSIDACSIRCPFIVEGNLNAVDSELLGYSFVYAPPYNSINHEIPSVLIQNAKNRNYEFLNTTISDDGYNALELRNLEDCSITVRGNVYGGERTNLTARNDPSYQGGHGIYITNCQNIEFFGFTFHGGVCSDFGYAISGDSVYEDGGHGMFAENSSIHLLLGSFSGGDSKNGVIVLYWKRDAGNGGDGIHLVNSDVIYDSYSATGGRGGAGAVTPNDIANGGQNGDPVWMDDASTFRSINDDVRVANWPLHE